jgi:hypothetical protein
MKTGSQFAFWRYDMFPYVLGGKIIRRFKDGTVEVEGYGPGFYFKPIKVMPYKQGESIWNALTDLRENKRTMEKALDTMFTKSAREIAPFIP